MKLSYRTLLWFCPVFLAAGLIYHPGLGGPFLFDDYRNIVNNPPIHITLLSGSALIDSLSGPDAGPLGRPVSVLSFALTHYFFGLDPFAFKTINLFIHFLNGLLVTVLFGIVLRRADTGLSESVRVWLPLWIGAVWVLHPINVIPVLLAVQRMTLLAGFFTLLALIGHVRGLLADKTAWKTAWLAMSWGLAWPLAVLSKETALLFPLYALIVSWAIASQTETVRLRWMSISILAVMAAIVLAFMMRFDSNWLERIYAMRPFTLYERLLTEARVLWFYAGQILLPSYQKFGLFLDDFPISRELVNPPSTILAIAGWLAVLAGSLMLLRNHRLLGLSILWFLAGHTLESSFLPLEIAHEHRNYLPSLGLIMLAGLLGLSLVTRMKEPREAGIAIAVAGFVTILAVSIYTGMRSKQYSVALKAVQMEVSFHPNSPRANYVAASTLMRHGLGAQNDPLGDVLVKYYFEESGRLDPSFKLGYVGLILWACGSQRPLEPAWLNELEQRLRETRFTPEDTNLTVDLLPALLNFKECVERPQALKIITAAGKNTQLRNKTRASFLEMAADYELLAHADLESATRFVRRALSLNPRDQGLREKLDSLELVAQKALGLSEK